MQQWLNVLLRTWDLSMQRYFSGGRVMPMTFTDKMIRDRAKAIKVDDKLPIEELREIVANHTEQFFGDYVEGWEVRTGRPWSEMTKDEAEELVRKHPHMVKNPGVLFHLMS